MQTYISVLRGINVGGNTIRMDELRSLFLDLQFENIRSYIQSGNIIFQSTAEDEKILTQQISDAIRKKFGVDIAVMVFSVESLKNILRNNPFVRDTSKESSFLHVTFLASSPDLSKEGYIRQKAGEGEAIHFSDEAVYLYCPNGYGRTKLHNNFLENQLKVKATTRNWKTANELLRLAEGAVH